MTAVKFEIGSRESMQACQQAIGYTFAQPQFLKAALTHSSGANNRGASNERLEFLGDSVLGLVTCEALFLRFPSYQEGDLTRVKSVVVSRTTCASFSKSLGMAKYLVLGKGLTNHVEPPLNILADVFEALVGAIFLDGGYDAAKTFVLHFIEPEIDRVLEQALTRDAKSRLQTLAQKTYGHAPRYVVLDEQGPDHDKCFKIAAEVDGRLFEPVWGRNKKEAEILAAQNALQELATQPGSGTDD